MKKISLKFTYDQICVVQQALHHFTDSLWSDDQDANLFRSLAEDLYIKFAQAAIIKQTTSMKLTEYKVLMIQKVCQQAWNDNEDSLTPFVRSNLSQIITQLNHSVT